MMSLPSSTICPHCGYDIRATVTPRGARCPECGKWSSTDDIRAHAERRTLGQRILRANRWVAPAFAAVAVLLLNPITDVSSDYVSAWAFIIGVFISMLSGVSIGRDLTAESTVWDRICTQFAAFVCIAVINVFIVVAGAMVFAWIDSLN